MNNDYDPLTEEEVVRYFEPWVPGMHDAEEEEAAAAVALPIGADGDDEQEEEVEWMVLGGRVVPVPKRYILRDYEEPHGLNLRQWREFSGPKCASHHMRASDPYQRLYESVVSRSVVLVWDGRSVASEVNQWDIRNGYEFNDVALDGNRFLCPMWCARIALPWPGIDDTTELTRRTDHVGCPAGSARCRQYYYTTLLFPLSHRDCFLKRVQEESDTSALYHEFFDSNSGSMTPEWLRDYGFCYESEPLTDSFHDHMQIRLKLAFKSVPKLRLIGAPQLRIGIVAMLLFENDQGKGAWFANKGSCDTSENRLVWNQKMRDSLLRLNVRWDLAHHGAETLEFFGCGDDGIEPKDTVMWMVDARPTDSYDSCYGEWYDDGARKSVRDCYIPGRFRDSVPYGNRPIMHTRRWQSPLPGLDIDCMLHVVRQVARHQLAGWRVGTRNAVVDESDPVLAVRLVNRAFARAAQAWMDEELSMVHALVGRVMQGAPTDDACERDMGALVVHLRHRNTIDAISVARQWLSMRPGAVDRRDPQSAQWRRLLWLRLRHCKAPSAGPPPPPLPVPPPSPPRAKARERKTWQLRLVVHGRDCEHVLASTSTHRTRGSTRLRVRLKLHAYTAHVERIRGWLAVSDADKERHSLVLLGVP